MNAERPTNTGSSREDDDQEKLHLHLGEAKAAK
jgi:hypothetical protein